MATLFAASLPTLYSVATRGSAGAYPAYMEPRQGIHPEQIASRYQGTQNIHSHT